MSIAASLSHPGSAFQREETLVAWWRTGLAVCLRPASTMRGLLADPVNLTNRNAFAALLSSIHFGAFVSIPITMLMIGGTLVLAMIIRRVRWDDDALADARFAHAFCPLAMLGLLGWVASAALTPMWMIDVGSLAIGALSMTVQTMCLFIGAMWTLILVLEFPRDP